MNKSPIIPLFIVISFISIGCSPTEADLSEVLEPDKHEIWRFGQSVYSPDFANLGYFSSNDKSLGAMFSSSSQGNLISLSADCCIDEYWIFPVPSSKKRIQSAKFLIATRTGTYDGDVVMNLEIFDFHGNLQHTVSSSPIDMQTTSSGVWTTVGLSGGPGDLVISPGEYLAFHWSLSGEKDTTYHYEGREYLQVGTLFEVEVIDYK